MASRSAGMPTRTRCAPPWNGAVEGGIVLPDGSTSVRAGETVPVTAITRPTGESQEVQTTLGAVIDAQSVEIRRRGSRSPKGSRPTSTRR